MKKKLVLFLGLFAFLGVNVAIAGGGSPVSVDTNVGAQGSHQFYVVNNTGQNVFIEMPFKNVAAGGGMNSSPWTITPGSNKYGINNGSRYAPKGEELRFAFDFSRLNTGNPGDAMVHQVTSHTYGGGQDNVTNQIRSGSTWKTLKMSMFVGGHTTTYNGDVHKIYTIYLSIDD